MQTLHPHRIEPSRWTFLSAAYAARTGRFVALGALALLCASEFFGLIPFRQAGLVRVLCLCFVMTGGLLMLVRRKLTLDLRRGMAAWGWRLGPVSLLHRAPLNRLSADRVATQGEAALVSLNRGGSRVVTLALPRNLLPRLYDTLASAGSPAAPERPGSTEPRAILPLRLAAVTAVFLAAAVVLLVLMWPLLTGTRSVRSSRQDSPRFQPNLFRVQQGLMQGMDAMRRQDYAEAKRQYTQVIAIDPTLEDARVLLARAHLEAGEPQQALAAARTGLRMARAQRWVLLELMGEIHERSGDLTRAHTYYLEALAHQYGPERSRTLTRLARVELSRGDTDRARDRLREALKTGANDEWVDSARQMLARLQPSSTSTNP